MYYVRELYQKQHHRRNWRKRHSFDLHSAKKKKKKKKGGIRVYATSGEAKREGVSRPHVSLRGIRRRPSVQKVPVPSAVHIWVGRRSVTGHWILSAEKRVSNIRLASVAGSEFLRNWKLSKRIGRTDRCRAVNSMPYHHYSDWCCVCGTGSRCQRRRKQIA